MAAARRTGWSHASTARSSPRSRSSTTGWRWPPRSVCGGRRRDVAAPPLRAGGAPPRGHDMGAGSPLCGDEAGHAGLPAAVQHLHGLVGRAYGADGCVGGGHHGGGAASAVPHRGLRPEPVEGLGSDRGGLRSGGPGQGADRDRLSPASRSPPTWRRRAACWGDARPCGPCPCSRVPRPSAPCSPPGWWRLLRAAAWPCSRRCSCARTSPGSWPRGTTASPSGTTAFTCGPGWFPGRCCCRRRWPFPSAATPSGASTGWPGAGSWAWSSSCRSPSPSATTTCSPWRRRWRCWHRHRLAGGSRAGSSAGGRSG